MKVFLRRVERGDDGYELWATLVENYHGYKQSARFIGRQLRYLVEENGYVVGCIGIGSYMHPEPSPLAVGIGWNKHQFNRGFNKVANVWRFTILPIAGENVASKALALLVKIVAKDWKEKYEASPYGNEKFNCKDEAKQCRRDETRNDLSLLVSLVSPYEGNPENARLGTCFTAAGWRYIGNTRGFGGKRMARGGSTIPGKRKSGFFDGKAVNMNQKLIFVKPLKRDWRERLYVRRYAQEECPHSRFMWYSIGRIVYWECSYCGMQREPIRYPDMLSALGKVRKETDGLGWKTGLSDSFWPWESPY